MATSYHVGCGHVAQAVSILRVLACVRGTANQNGSHAILPWCGKLLYLPKCKVNLHMSWLLITTFNFSGKYLFCVWLWGWPFPPLIPRTNMKCLPDIDTHKSITQTYLAISPIICKVYLIVSLFFHRECCYRILFKNPTHALCFKIHTKTQSLFKTLECLHLLCHRTCFGHTLDHLQGMFLVQGGK